MSDAREVTKLPVTGQNINQHILRQRMILSHESGQVVFCNNVKGLE